MSLVDLDRYDWRNMYRNFIERANEDKDFVSRKLSRYTKLLTKIKYQVEQNRNAVEAIFDVCIYNYWEWNTDELDVTCKLENAIDRKFIKFDDQKQFRYGGVYNTLKQYFRVLRKITNCQHQLERIKNRCNVTREDYLEYCRRYFGQVAKEVLRGKIYKFDRYIGSLMIERIKPDTEYKTATGVIKAKKSVDWQSTRISKQKLIEKGVEPYLLKNAVYALLNNLPYNGQKYFVYWNDEWYCRAIMIDGKFKNRRLFRFKVANTHDTTTNDEILANCKTVEDIINLENIDIKRRISLIKRFDPTYTIKYIRNNEQRTVFYRNYNRAFRQRL